MKTILLIVLIIGALAGYAAYSDSRPLADSITQALR